MANPMDANPWKNSPLTQPHPREGSAPAEPEGGDDPSRPEDDRRPDLRPFPAGEGHRGFKFRSTPPLEKPSGAPSLDHPPSGESLSRARPLGISPARTRRRLRVDRLTRRLVTLGGVTIILSILAILFVIAAEVFPLFYEPTTRQLATIPQGRGQGTGNRGQGWGSREMLASDSRQLAPAQRKFLDNPLIPMRPLLAGVDEYREVAFLLGDAGAIQFVSLKDRRPLAPVSLAGLEGSRPTAVASAGEGRYVVGTSDGRVIPFEVRFHVAYDEDRRTVTPQVVFQDPVVVDPERKRPIRNLAFAVPEGGPVLVAQVGPNELVRHTVQEKKALIGPATREASIQPFHLPAPAEVTALALDNRADDLFLGTAEGEILRYDLRQPTLTQPGGIVNAARRPGAGISALVFLLGDRSLVVGDRAGGVGTWQMVQPSEGGERRLVRIHAFTPHRGAVIALARSQRDKGFLSADTSGVVRLHYATSGETLLSARVEGARGLRSVIFAPKADGWLAVDDQGTLSHWEMRSSHPEVTLRSLFGRLWYEGYEQPEYVWQSTGGTDDFEPKLSLTPLIYGTLKGTLYALLFAVPLALASALYTSQFMHPRLKGAIKPIVEIMAALPSVVLGFLAGLWLAPMIERVVPGIFLLPVVIPLLILAALLLWQLLPAKIRAGIIQPGSEIVLLLPLVLAGGWLSFQLGGLVEVTLLAGDYRGWLLRVLGLTYDQRNSLVVGFAMGFAVIPIIFTIAEDSLSNVPQHLTIASLALGATRWQTAIRVVLPTASPGIFSAIMIGFGRAVGETMIVLMATGNTPVMDWSIFNGFRALSANIAVELPEAPVGGTLYRVLFLAAFLLFVITFLVNTVAELVRLRLRKRYQCL